MGSDTRQVGKGDGNAVGSLESGPSQCVAEVQM